jgi:beta-lactamase class A
LRLQLFGIALAIAAAIVSAQSLASAREGAASYVIQPGDTLLSIAGNTGVALDRLISLNGIKDPDVIVAGKTLTLQGGAATQEPAAGANTPPATAPAAGTYRVKTGDTLWDIAQTNKVSVDALLKANSLDNGDRLSVGQQLTLPAAQRSGQARASQQTQQTQQAQSGQQGQQGQQTQPAKSAALQQKVLAEAQRVGGPNARVGIAAINLVSGDRLAIKADESFPSASVMKLPILVELERQIAAGTVKWNDQLRNDATQMISVSDNEAANRLADRVSMVAVNDEMRALGLGGTRFLNTFVDTRTPRNPGQNATTPSNMARLLELIATDQIVNSATSADIRGLLARNTDRSKLVRLLSPDAKVAHKSGWYDGVANDVGIVTVERVPTRWVIAVFTQNVPDGETGNQVVAAVSKAVYDAWAN